jgi:hypothetical protein
LIQSHPMSTTSSSCGEISFAKRASSLGVLMLFLVLWCVRLGQICQI